MVGHGAILCRHGYNTASTEKCEPLNTKTETISARREVCFIQHMFVCVWEHNRSQSESMFQLPYSRQRRCARLEFVHNPHHLTKKKCIKSDNVVPQRSICASPCLGSSRSIFCCPWSPPKHHPLEQWGRSQRAHYGTTAHVCRVFCEPSHYSQGKCKHWYGSP